MAFLRSNARFREQNGPLAQLAEQQTLNLRVLGSIPRRLTHFPEHFRDVGSPTSLLTHELTRWRSLPDQRDLGGRHRVEHHRRSFGS